MKVSVLLSCMNQDDASIIRRSNVQTDAVVINQCNKDEIKEFCFTNISGKECRVKFISTTERGLSKSRNMAIRNATADICIICDDDEVLEDNYEKTVIEAFRRYQEGVLAFKIKHPTRIYKNHTYKIGFFRCATVGSWQLVFRRDMIISNNIFFNEKMGSGTGNGAGEENRFVMDCYKKKLGIRYIPEVIGTLVPSGESQWFKGFTQEYWVNRGWQSKMVFGKFFGYLYIWYFACKHKSDKTNPFARKLKWMHTGYYINR